MSPPRPDAEPARFPGRSEAARRFEAELERVAPAAVTVLLQGESGSGKSLAARHLHALSARARGPLVEVHLAALTPTLIEAELFGHEAGAYTGASHARAGRFASAGGGTLVLDGVDALAEPVQAKLLRALQERLIEPLGAEAPVPIDVRVVATTTRPLEELVAAGRFREDLYYRLAVVTLHVPPLRARLDDLPGLVETLVRAVAERVRVAPRAFTPAALERLRAHGWPGNVRELENAVERVLVLGADRGAGAPVAPEELGFLSAERPQESARVAREALALGLSLEELSQALIEEALREERGNATAAARRLGLTRRALEYRRRRAQDETAARGEAPA